MSASSTLEDDEFLIHEDSDDSCECPTLLDKDSRNTIIFHSHHRMSYRVPDDPFLPFYSQKINFFGGGMSSNPSKREFSLVQGKCFVYKLSLEIYYQLLIRICHHPRS